MLDKIFRKDKIKEIEENVKILDFITRNKTKSTYAFALDEISNGTGIKNLTHERLLKIENIVFTECYGQIYYTYISIEEQFQDSLDRLVKNGKIKEEITKDGIKVYKATENGCINNE